MVILDLWPLCFECFDPLFSCSVVFVADTSSFRAPPAPACWRKVREFVSRSFCRGRLLWSCLGQAICFSFTSSTPSSRNLFSSHSSLKWSDHAVLVTSRHPKHSQRQEIQSPDSHQPKPSHNWLSSPRITVIFWMLPPS